MTEKISLAAVNESGDVVPIEPLKNMRIGIKIEIAIADTFAEIRNRINAETDEEIRTAEKFEFALNLKNYLKELKEQYAK